MTVAAVLAFALAQVWNLPLHGLWAVLTAVVLTQISVGGSLHATTEYVMGTIAGAIYAAGVGVLVPHTTTMALAGVLALTIAPLDPCRNRRLTTAGRSGGQAHGGEYAAHIEHHW